MSKRYVKVDLEAIQEANRNILKDRGLVPWRRYTNDSFSNLSSSRFEALDSQGVGYEVVPGHLVGRGDGVLIYVENSKKKNIDSRMIPINGRGSEVPVRR